MFLIKLLRSFRAWAFVQDFEPVFIQFNQCKLVDVEKALRVAAWNCNKHQITRLCKGRSIYNGPNKNVVVGNVAA